MAHYFVGDEPRGILTITPASILDAAEYPTAEADMRAPSGLVQPLTATPATVEGETVVNVELAGLLLDEPGVWQLLVTLTDETAGAQRARSARPVRVPVEATGSVWYLIDQARADWPGAPDEDARLHDLLQVAQGQVLAYAPALTDAEGLPLPVPLHYMQAQLMQARNIWNAYQIDPNANTYGPDGFQVTVYPMDWSVKQMLRPKRAVPRVA